MCPSFSALPLAKNVLSTCCLQTGTNSLDGNPAEQPAGLGSIDL